MFSRLAPCLHSHLLLMSSILFWVALWRSGSHSQEVSKKVPGWCWIKSSLWPFWVEFACSCSCCHQPSIWTCNSLYNFDRTMTVKILAFPFQIVTHWNQFSYCCFWKTQTLFRQTAKTQFCIFPKTSCKWGLTLYLTNVPLYYANYRRLFLLWGLMFLNWLTFSWMCILPWAEFELILLLRIKHIPTHSCGHLTCHLGSISFV